MKNKLSIHPLQSIEWGKFREKTGIKVIRINGIQITIHRIPYSPWSIGYIPKGPSPTVNMISDLKKIGKQEKCIFIQLEPNVIKNSNFEFRISNLGLIPAAHPLFTKYTFILDLTRSEEELLAAMHQKTRYNIKVALKHEVKIIQDESNEGFKTYLKLTEETTNRQKFYAHTQKYHRLMWETLRTQSSKFKVQSSYDELTAHLFLAKYKEETLAAWILFVYKDTLYYPYGASSILHRETMASNLMMWEAIKFGKKLGLKKFDMWGALNNDNPDKNDPWYGFHRFKEGYGPEHVEFIGSFDLIINPLFYLSYKVLNKIRWILLRIKK
jgi:lipid II:glycine glycyltransferase (peptidoglycan interpeptide bridge formation enzyme)